METNVCNFKLSLIRKKIPFLWGDQKQNKTQRHFNLSTERREEEVIRI